MRYQISAYAARHCHDTDIQKMPDISKTFAILLLNCGKRCLSGLGIVAQLSHSKTMEMILATIALVPKASPLEEKHFSLTTVFISILFCKY